jgi:hypothetical protein
MNVKKPIITYNSYMWVLQCKKTNNYLQDLYVDIAYLKWPYENYNRTNVGITQC